MKYSNFISRSEEGKMYTCKVKFCDTPENIGLYYHAEVSPHALNALDTIELYTIATEDNEAAKIKKGDYIFSNTFEVRMDEDGDFENIAFGKLTITEGDKQTYYLPLEVFKKFAVPFASLTEARKFDWPL